MKFYIYLTLCFLLVSCKGSEKLPPWQLVATANLTGEYAESGPRMLDSVSIIVDAVNQSGGVAGRQIELVEVDDKGDSDLAVSNVSKIAEYPNLFAVIGHDYSSTSLPASQGYLQHKIPVISPSATSPELTKGNPWYFRTIIDDRQLGTYVGVHMANALKIKKLVTVYIDDKYGKSVQKAMLESSDKLGMEVLSSTSIDFSSLDDPLVKSDISSQFKKLDKDTAILLATYDWQANTLIEIIREAGQVNPIIVAGDSFASYPLKPNFKPVIKSAYTYNLFGSTQFLYDVGGKKFSEYREQYLAKFGREPNAYDVTGADAAIVAIEALIKAETDNADNDGTQSKSIKDVREAVRANLAAYDNYQNSADGVSGPIYFDKNGDPVQTVLIGQFAEGQLYSHPIQYYAVPQSEQQHETSRFKNMPHFDGQTFLETQVVYTGVNVKSVYDCEYEAKVCMLEFDLWFRHSGSFDARELNFTNALEQVDIGKPVIKLNDGELHYERYHIKGLFRLDYQSGKVANQHEVGIHYQHRFMSNDGLLFVKGSNGEDNQALVQQHMQKMRLQLGDWRIASQGEYVDTAVQQAIGIRRAHTGSKDSSAFSRFNFIYKLERPGFSILTILPSNALPWIVSISALGLFFMVRGFVVREFRTTHAWRFILFGVFSVILIQSASEYILTNVFYVIDEYYLFRLEEFLATLWWFFPAILVSMVIERYLWSPLEEYTGRKVPNLIRWSVFFLLGLFALFGVIAFVFGYQLTSLLATSGLLAMIIGLAIQANIANVFSGIVLNLDNKVKIGHKVKITTEFINEIATVKDISWRSVELVTNENNTLIVPNAAFAELFVTNYSLISDGTASQFEPVIKAG